MISLQTKWSQWVAQALVQGVPIHTLQKILEQKGHENPKKLIESVQNNPLFTWGKEHAYESRTKQFYLNLQAQLYRERFPKQDERNSSIARVSCIDEASFFQDYYYSHRPIIIEDWASKWPATQSTWRAERFIEDFANVPIEYVSGRTLNSTYDIHSKKLKTTGTFGDYARRVLLSSGDENDFYLIARNYLIENPQLSTLLDEIDERPYCDPKKRKNCLALWFGPQGTVTPLHHDTCQIMFVQIWGSKRFILIPPYRMDLYESSHHMYSSIDPEKKELCPDQITVDLHAGEALFIPVAWWHHVRALSPSISLAMTHFTHANDYDWYRPGRSAPNVHNFFKD